MSSFALAADAATWGNSMTARYDRSFMGSGDLGKSFMGGPGPAQGLPSFLFKGSFEPPTKMTSGYSGGAGIGQSSIPASTIGK